MEPIPYEANRRRAPWVLAALAAALVGAAAIFLLTRGDDDAPAPAEPASTPTETLERFYELWAGGDFGGASKLVAEAPAKMVAKALEENVSGLDGASLRAEVLTVAERGVRAEATVAMSWEVPAIGKFEYESDVTLAKAGEGWSIAWDSTAIHPALTIDGTRLGTFAEFPDRAPILDRNGRALMKLGPVTDVGLVPRKAEDPIASANEIAALLGIDAAPFRRAVRAAVGPEQFVSALILRNEEAAPLRPRLLRISGVLLVDRLLPLAPTRDFARALLGGVGPITAEQLEELGPPYTSSSVVGQWGLQASFEERLAGTPTRSVITRSADGVPVATLLEVKGERSRPLRTTIDQGVQGAAESALEGIEGNAALVAVEPSSGDVLAVANRPALDTFDRALDGQYPPGSTFKVVSTTALLGAGLDRDESVDCPATIVVGGLEFRNFEGGALGLVPFRTDFAQSCNTAFVSLSDRLGSGDLPETAALFGLGAEPSSAVSLYTGSVPPAADDAELAASMIGQGRILVSPVALAGVAATVAEGRWRAPRIVSTDPREAGPKLPAEDLAILRELMRLVVTSGTGTALAAVPGEPAGKSGTAEFGTSDPPETHAWFIAFRDDLAVAVIVEGGVAGGAVAAPVVAEFFAALDG